VLREVRSVANAAQQKQLGRHYLEGKRKKRVDIYIYIYICLYIQIERYIDMYIDI